MDKLLSLCMIVRDEENVLERCLESVQGLVDEIIIVDTGSIDKTKEIAAKYTDKIYDFVWINDFSAAKNEAIRKATGKWILSLDADEYLVTEEHEALKDYLLTVNPDVPIGIVLPIFNLIGSAKTRKFIESSACRLFPNHENIIFYRPIHEQIKHTKMELSFVNFHGIKIYHTGYIQEIRNQKDKTARNMKIFETLTEKTDYDFFTLGNEYMNLENYKKALYYFERAHKKWKNVDQAWSIHCVNQMVTAYMSLDRYKEAYQLIEESLATWPDYSDYYFFKGFVLDFFGLYQDAIVQLNKSIQVAEKPKAKSGRFWLTAPNYGSVLPYSLLANIYTLHQDYENSIYCLTKLISIDNKDSMLIFRLVSILLKTESTAAIIPLLEQLVPTHSKENVIRLFQVSLLIGNSDLCQHYYSISANEQITITSYQAMHYALVVNDRSLFDVNLRNYLVDENQADMNKTLCLAACLWQDPVYLKHMSFHKDSLFLQCSELLQVSLTQSNLTDPGEDFNADSIVLLLTELFKFKYFDSYDWLINLFPAHFHKLANRLGDYFFSVHEIELALDYYSLLLKEDKLYGAGYENLARLYINQGMLDEGLEFLSKAIGLNPKSLKLYTLMLQNCPDIELKNKYKQMFLDNYSQYKGLPFIQEILKD